MLLMLLMIIITCRLSPVPKHDNFPIIYHHTRVNNSSSTPSKKTYYSQQTQNTEVEFFAWCHAETKQQYEQPWKGHSLCPVTLDRVSQLPATRGIA